MGRTIGIYGESGTGKTTQGGELVKEKAKAGKRSKLYASDRGGYSSIAYLVELGVLEVDELGETEDPWQWTNMAVEGKDRDGNPLADDIGLVIYDSATSMGEALLSSCATLSAAGEDIGGRPAPKIVINKSELGKQIKIGTNVDTHYGVVQGFMKVAIDKSTWLAKKGNGPDLLWTFGLYKGEDQTNGAIYGPELAGRALTPKLPKWLGNIFPLVKTVQQGMAPEHTLLLQSQPDSNGLATYYVNSRYPLGVTPLPVSITPASLVEALALIEQGQQEALMLAREELGR